MNQVVNTQRDEAAEYTQIVSGAAMEIFRRLGCRIAGEATLGGVIRESLTAEEPFQQKSKRTPAVEKARRKGFGAEQSSGKG